MKVYIFTGDTNVCGEKDLHVEAFANKQDALAYFERFTKQYKADAINDGWDIYDESPESFAAFEPVVGPNFELDQYYMFNIFERYV